MKQESIEMMGTVIEECSNGTFKVELNSDLPLVFCTISGKLRKNFIRIMTGDKVKIEMSPYDLTKGRISQRLGLDGKPTTASTLNNKNNHNPKQKKK